MEDTMSQFDLEEDSPRGYEHEACGSFEMGLPENNLMEEISERLCPPGEASPREPNDAQSTRFPDGERNGHLNQLRVMFSGPKDVASALKSFALSYAWGFEGIHMTLLKRFTVPGLSEREADYSPPADEDENDEGQPDPTEDELPAASFHSKYIQEVPLYQDYCLSRSSQSEMVSSQSELVSSQSELVDCSQSELVSCSQSELVSCSQSELVSCSQSELVSCSQSELVSCSQSELVSSSRCLLGLRSSPLLPYGTRIGVGSPLQQPRFLKMFVAPPPACSAPSWTLWQNLSEVKELGLLATLTTREVRLQEAMFEMIGSEASYLRSIGVAVKHFYASKALRQKLSRMEHHVLFSNLRDVMTASGKFLMDLEVRLDRCAVISQIGDIVLQHCPTFHALYVPYVTNMMFQEALVSQLLLENKGFLLAVRKLEMDPVCQRQGLKSFLVLPFQRITRLKIIMENILRLTEPDSDSILCLKEAIEAIHKIVVECDEGVRKMKRIEELVHLDKMVDFGNIKSIPLIVSHRYLVHQGALRQLTMEGAQSWRSRTSFIDVYLHLFNDLLLISSKRQERFNVLEYAVFPTHVHTTELKSGGLDLPSDCFLLHLSHNHAGQATALILVPHTRSDRELWVKALSSTC